MPEIPVSSEVNITLKHGLESSGVSRKEALALLLEAPTKALLQAAAAVRDRFKGRTISYSRKVFIPLTHLCRNYCGYCTFRSDPKDSTPAYMTPDEVLALAEAGRRAGCKEALFTMGDQPEAASPEAKQFLRKLGFHRTLEYLAAMNELVLDKTGLLPHSNPGVAGEADLRRLRETNASMGLMLECISPRLSQPNLAHAKSPDKAPAVRMRTIESAGKLAIPYTTGLLIGIGESLEERVDTLLAIRMAHEEHGHIQEVIVQPFRTKPDIPMAQMPEPTTEDLQRTIAIARLVLGGNMNIQSPPNLMSEGYTALLEAGINDWGGVSPVTQDCINPEAAWPEISALEARTTAAGFVLRERLAIYPEFCARPEFTAARMKPHVDRLRSANGYARTTA